MLNVSCHYVSSETFHHLSVTMGTYLSFIGLLNEIYLLVPGYNQINVFGNMGQGNNPELMMYRGKYSNNQSIQIDGDGILHLCLTPYIHVNRQTDIVSFTSYIF